VTSETAEQIKGVKYSLSCFLGESFGDRITKSDKRFYHIVIYLAPGDYHRFHSPAEITIHERRHFPGFMLSVSKFVANHVEGLFAINERVVLSGKWPYGYFAFCPVAATNVGDIYISGDPELKTNLVTQNHSSPPSSIKFDELSFQKGEEIGAFRLGSTVVLVFECPEFQFSCKEGEHIKLGQSLGEVNSNA